MTEQQIIEKIKESNVSYCVLGKTDRSAMPLGNGELCTSVWVNEKGKICFYISRSDALSELDRTLKLGMVILDFYPNPFLNGHFTQTLDVADGNIRFQGDETEIYMCIDPECNQILMQGNFARETKISASYYTWRDKARCISGEFGEYNEIFESADTVKTLENGIVFYHKNGPNIIEITAKNQEVEKAVQYMPDFLTNRIFGGYMELQGSVTENGTATIDSVNQFFLRIFTESMQTNEAEFEKVLLNHPLNGTMGECLERCRKYWNTYWKNSYIFVENGSLPQVTAEEKVLHEIKEPTEYSIECSSQITIAYLLTRFMFKCCGNGKFPILYNGMLFNLCPGQNQHFRTDSMGEICTATPNKITRENNPDERPWCVEQLWQNIRHPYHTFLYQGEVESLQVLFSYYRRFWALNRYRAKEYYQADGQHNTEMTMSFGLQSIGIYGENRAGKPKGYAENRHGGAVDISPGLELLSLMLDYYEYSEDSYFFKEELQIYAKDLYRYVETRFSTRNDNKLVVEPLNSIETYWDTKNPIPVIAGLQSTVDRLLKANDLSDNDRKYFEEYKKKIPELPKKEEDGIEYLQPAESFKTERKNVEIPELYACFPFGIYDQFSDAEGIMKRTFEKRIEEYQCDQYFKIGNVPQHPSYSGWQYQGIIAAKLGIKEKAKEILEHNVQLKNPGTRFPVMWGPIYDGVPDTDHGANIVHLLQEMVMQVKEDKIYILPAFPEEWNVAFKLHPTAETSIELEYKNGKIERINVYPEKDRNKIIFVNE